MISLTPDLDRAVKQLGWTAFTPVQELAIPPLRAGRDLFAQAQTGTGKTGAFALPILERVVGRAGAPFTLVVVPTRELGQQVAGGGGTVQSLFVKAAESRALDARRRARRRAEWRQSRRCFFLCEIIGPVATS